MTVPAIDPSGIAETIEANINAYLLSFARLPGAILHHDQHSVWIDSGVPDATFNSVVYVDFSPDTVDAQIQTVLDHFRSRSLPFTWHIGPSSRPPDLDRFLLAHGLRHDEDEPGMAIELDHMRDDVESPADLTIETVQDERGLEAWVNVWLFGAPSEIRRLYLDALRGRGLGDDCPWRYFIGRLHGKAVAISELFIGEGVASVQYVVTLPEVRHQGIGTAMTLQVLREARLRGYRVAVLTSSPEGIGIYRKLGFRECCWFRRYEQNT